MGDEKDEPNDLVRSYHSLHIWLNRCPFVFHSMSFHLLLNSFLLWTSDKFLRLESQVIVLVILLLTYELFLWAINIWYIRWIEKPIQVEERREGKSISYLRNHMCKAKEWVRDRRMERRGNKRIVTLHFDRKEEKRKDVMRQKKRGEEKEKKRKK